MRFTPWVGYHQLYVAPLEVWPVYDQARDEQVVQDAAGGRSLIIVTGIAMGPITLDVELRDRADDERDPGGWEDSFVGEMNIVEPLYVFAPTIDAGVSDAVFTSDAPGTYGFQVLARARGDHYDHVVENPVEDYLLWFWPL